MAVLYFGLVIPTLGRDHLRFLLWKMQCMVGILPSPRRKGSDVSGLLPGQGQALPGQESGWKTCRLLKVAQGVGMGS